MNRKERCLLVGIVVINTLVGLCSAAAPCPFGDSGSSGSAGSSTLNDPFMSADPCPFDDSGGAGAVDPFPDIDPAASQVPCPFDDTGQTGNVDPFPDIDPAAIVIPCPFPCEGTASGEMSIDSATCGETYPAPADIDGDGTYEDLNGNGRTDFADVRIYFRNMEWIRTNQPLSCFDYNANGNIDFADLILLFREV
jgi:PKD repeat protein